MGWSTRALLVLGLSPVLACGLIENLACDDDCEGSSEPPRGERADFTLAGRDDENATITIPAVCDEFSSELRSHLVTVTTHGSDTDVDFSEWVIDRLEPELQARDLSVGRGLVRCPLLGETINYGLITADWQKLDPIAETILDLAAEDDVAIEIALEVEPIFTECADKGCGF